MMDTLKGSWLELFEELTSDTNHHKGSELSGFTETFTGLVEEALKSKQRAGSSIGISTAANLIEECRKAAINQIRATFKDRLDNETLIRAVRRGMICTIPGEESKGESKPKRFVTVSVGIETITLSNREVQYLVDACEEKVELDMEQFMLVAKCYKFDLEGPEATPSELVSISALAKKSRPEMVRYISSDLNVSWKVFAKSIGEAIISATKQRLAVLKVK